MKKILFVLALVLPMIFASCSKDEDEKGNETLEMILGTWEISQVDTNGKGYQDWTLEKTSATFNNDGTYSGKGYFGNGTGTYKLEGKTISCFVSGEEFLKYDILNLSDNNCELRMYVTGSDKDMKIKCTKK